MRRRVINLVTLFGLLVVASGVAIAQSKEFKKTVEFSSAETCEYPRIAAVCS
jgi:hypothetical protein